MGGESERVLASKRERERERDGLRITASRCKVSMLRLEGRRLGGVREREKQSSGVETAVSSLNLSGDSEGIIPL